MNEKQITKTLNHTVTIDNRKKIMITGMPFQGIPVIV